MIKRVKLLHCINESEMLHICVYFWSFIYRLRFSMVARVRKLNATYMFEHRTMKLCVNLCMNSCEKLPHYNPESVLSETHSFFYYKSVFPLRIDPV